MKIIIAGGSGFLGTHIARYYADKGDAVVVFTRKQLSDNQNVKYVQWDGKTMGKWSAELEGADVLVNLTGKSVNCRYNERNKALIYSSRTDATKILGEACKACAKPPKLWMNASSATIYRYAMGRPMDEATGELGEGFSVDVCRRWEKSFNEITLPETRKVILRMALVLGHGGGVFPTLSGLVKKGMGGKNASGKQFVSWIHIDDFLAILDYIIDHHELTGIINVAAPNPLPNKDFMKAFRKAAGVPFGLPLMKWMIQLGAVFMGTEPELVLKSRRVVPGRLLEDGYRFKFDYIEEALQDLYA